MLATLLEKLRHLFTRRGSGRRRASILLPFLIISIGLGVLAWRSYNLSVRAEQGAKDMALQYSVHTAGIIASRVDSAVRAELALVSDEWQQMERRMGEPTFEGLSEWLSHHAWIVSAIYVPDYDPASTIYVVEATKSAGKELRLTREFFTASGSIKYTYDPKRLLTTPSVVAEIRQRRLPQQPPKLEEIRQSAAVSLVTGQQPGIVKMEDGFATVATLAPPLEQFAIRSEVRTSYVGGTGWENQRVISLWVSLLALLLLGGGASLALRGMNKEAETMKLRGALIANVSHELRTPLSMIRLGAETLKRGAKLKEKERADIEDQILREVLLLSHLVENVLDVARIQNRSQKALAFTPVHPRDLIRNLLTTYESWIRSKGFTCDVQIDDAIGEQMWDRDAVSRALLNLIDNAIKYSGDDKAIEVVLRQDEQYIIIEVKDHGIGISQSDLQKIFDPYFRAQFSDTITRRGAGLGLTLVQQIVESHGGKVEVESVAGSGSTFRLMFPRGLAGDPAQIHAYGAPREAF